VDLDPVYCILEDFNATDKPTSGNAYGSSIEHSTMSSEAAVSSMMRGLGSFVDIPVDAHESSDSESTVPVFARCSVQFAAASAPESPLRARDPLLIEGNREEIGERDKQSKQSEMLGRADSFEDLEVGHLANQKQSSPVHRKGNQRVSMVRDLSTGQLGIGRAQCAQVGVFLILMIYRLLSRQLTLFSFLLALASFEKFTKRPICQRT
jgi:hypothetical protein